MVGNGLQPLRKTNLREHILEQLRETILDGTYRPGERLVEMGIAEQLQVSRAPVREALSALEREGLVVQIARRGYFVVDFTKKDVEEVYSLRLLMEVEALRRAATRATELDYQELQRLVDSLAAAAAERTDATTIVALDLAFHDYLCRLADHGRLLTAWNSLRQQTQMLLGITSRTHLDRPDEPRKWHQTILDHMRAGNIEDAQRVLSDHVQDAQRRALSVLD